jgi:hypothetical protein
VLHQVVSHTAAVEAEDIGGAASDERHRSALGPGVYAYVVLRSQRVRLTLRSA